MSKHAQFRSEISPATRPLPVAVKPPSTTSTVNKTVGTGISADAPSQNAPKTNGNCHLPPLPEENPVSNSAFSANSARRCSLKNYEFDPNKERALSDSELKVAGCWRQFVSGKSALIKLIKALMQVERRGAHGSVGGNPLGLPGRCVETTGRRSLGYVANGRERSFPGCQEAVSRSPGPGIITARGGRRKPKKDGAGGVTSHELR
jgi:hypothetical protein